MIECLSVLVLHTWGCYQSSHLKQESKETHFPNLSKLFLKGKALTKQRGEIPFKACLPAASQTLTAPFYTAQALTAAPTSGSLDDLGVCVWECVCVCLDLGSPAGCHWFVYLRAADSFSLGFFCSTLPGQETRVCTSQPTMHDQCGW